MRMRTTPTGHAKPSASVHIAHCTLACRVRLVRHAEWSRRWRLITGSPVRPCLSLAVSKETDGFHDSKFHTRNILIAHGTCTWHMHMPLAY
jgi:hypothetical protein